jgi:hypothetical protein
MNKRQRKQIDSIYRQSEFNLKLALTNIVALCASDEEKVNEIHAFLLRQGFRTNQGRFIAQKLPNRETFYNWREEADRKAEKAEKEKP